MVLGWWFSRPLPLPSSPFVFEVKPGMSLKSVARDLAGSGVLRWELPFVALARYRRVDRSIKAGNYEIAAGVTMPRLLDKLTQGDVTQSALTVVEGGTFAEFAAALASNPAIVKTVVDCLTISLRNGSACRERISKAGSFRTRIFSRPAPRISDSSSAPIG